ncbi:uncharacterized protein LOC121785856 [Salvia splendens]|uniref:uncharacterized protein LOC121785856 n=1 Tax=Salvia splendens TaxID=180675 RepID=UPI001C27F8C9|nr:uncharacterized protein LOC121785856 [Salvia splendens]
MLEQLLEACKRMESRFDEIDRRIDNDAVYGSLESMNEFIPDEVVVTCPMNFDMVMLEDNKTNDGGDQPMDSGDHPMESGGDAPQVPVEKKMTDALLDVDITMLEVMERVDEDSLLFHANGSHLGTMLLVSRWLSMEPNEEYYWTKQSGIFDLGGNISQSSDWKKSESFIGTKIIIQIRCHVIVDYGRTKQQSFAVDPGGEVSPKLVFTMLFIVSWFPP